LYFKPHGKRFKEKPFNRHHQEAILRNKIREYAFNIKPQGKTFEPSVLRTPPLHLKGDMGVRIAREDL
jgi:hypothetical protein